MLGVNYLALVASTLLPRVSAQACTQSGGDWYCNQVNAVSFSNFGSSGSYKQVSYMSDITGQCSFSDAAYGGAIAPFNEDLSIHIRGPFSLKQFAFYTPQSPSSRRRDVVERSRPDLRERSLIGTVCPQANSTTVTSANGKYFKIECGMDRQGYLSSSKRRNFAACIRLCADTTTCTQVSWVVKDKVCYLKSSSIPLRPQDYVRGIAGARLVKSDGNKKLNSPYPSPPAASSSSPITWTRRSYYSSRSQVSSGLTFLNNMGGGNYPGIWSTRFGNSLGYASTDGLSPAHGPQILSDTTLPSTSEISIWTALPCSPIDPCPYSRPGTVAYHGFSGASKILLFEFSMPHDAAAGAADTPALWLLNARIPRTQQYGPCSCWGNTDGCGELDVWEVLARGEERMVSAVHGAQAATNPNWFGRPTGGTMKGAVVLTGSRAVIKVLDDDFEFGTGLTDELYRGLVADGPPSVPVGEVARMSLPN